MINVFLNAQATSFSAAGSLLDFIEQHAGNGPFAAAVNETFVPKSQYGDTPLKDGDRIDIVNPMQGG